MMRRAFSFAFLHLGVAIKKNIFDKVFVCVLLLMRENIKHIYLHRNSGSGVLFNYELKNVLYLRLNQYENRVLSFWFYLAHEININL